MTDTTVAGAQEVIQTVAGVDPNSLLTGLTEGEAEELLELLADLAGMGAAPGEHTVGIATPELREMSRTLEYELADHLWSENMVPLIFYGTEERLPGNVISWFTSHVTLSSGMYLGGASCRYALAKHKRDTAKNNGQRNVWQKEMDRAKAMVDYLVEGQHRNINIGKNWSGQNGQGEAGLLFRFTWDAAGPIPGEPNSHHGCYLLPWEDGKQYWCMGNVSRDMYDGVLFGLLLAFDLVSVDDPAMRTQIRNDVVALADYQVRHGWIMVFPEPALGSSEPLNPNPLFTTSPVSQLRLLQAARYVSSKTGSLVDKLKWEGIWNTQYALLKPLTATTNIGKNPTSSYFGYNLDHLKFFDLIRLEPNATVRTSLKQDFAPEDANSRDDINAHFEAITYALTGEPERRDLSAEHLHDWLIYWAEWYLPRNNSAGCGVDYDCVPEDTVITDYPLPGGGTYTTTQPGSSATMRSTEPLPIYLRPGDYNLWFRHPYILDRAATTPIARSSGTDFLLPYYMLRYFTEAKIPALDPFPAYNGPTTH